MESQAKDKIPRRILGTLINSLGSGVVPRFGLEYIAIGRAEEIGAITGDLNFIEEGGAAFRFVIGRYGSGKSFLLQLMRSHCLERGFITADADLSPERRLSGTKGQGIAIYRELMTNLASKGSPDGGALIGVITKWLNTLQTKIITEKGYALDSPEIDREMTAEILKVGGTLEGLVCGFDFASVIAKYYAAHRSGDETRKSAAIKWLRGEFLTKSEAREAIGAGVIIDDRSWYDFLKLFAVFIRKIGYKGMVIFIDECVNLYKIPNRISRENNYEKILAMFNDTMQGKAEGIGFFMGGTPQFLEDNRRGLYSYEALKSRLSDTRFTQSGYKNLSGPIIRLERLTDDEIFALVIRMRNLWTTYNSAECAVSDEDIRAYLTEYMSKAGASTLVTPREIIRDFLSLLDILKANPEANFRAIVAKQIPSDDAAKAEAAETAEDTTTAFTMEFNDFEV
ncbi:biotin carboxylase [Clostridia bacterium]|nr:biotin carboxylase [Clostridia bacterium]